MNVAQLCRSILSVDVMSLPEFPLRLALRCRRITGRPVPSSSCDTVICVLVFLMPGSRQTWAMVNRKQCCFSPIRAETFCGGAPSEIKNKYIYYCIPMPSPTAFWAGRESSIRLDVQHH